ncbi:uncharacterized protein EAF01_010072 [Botrytis porri]|uniref:Uncharacterized protein n=1 Tax=Botrytis porri TaxID=87229 RepID=A0A4Z1KC35_9HELO|nr:uncharacterized protein EAF01_010072 [Botrytis porri]KAF7894622.1 hypothetical protein EAF01_010072 [Botrytis porri]TGO81750.1 hypothetical protein BPOR_1031g00010 [Botrytis porri]
MSSPTRRSSALSPSPPPKLHSPILLEAPKESAVVRFIIAPITFISFLISLLIIDSRNSYLRIHQHSETRKYSNTFIGRIQEFLHRLIYKPQPYAYIKSPSQGQNAGGIKRKEEEPWHWNTKQKKMIKMEVSDAFKLRQWVLVGMAVVATGVGLVVLYLGNWIWQISYRDDLDSYSTF